MDTRNAARLLGAAGAVPFVVLSHPVVERMPMSEEAKRSAGKLQVAYGASILSFLGAVHWGCVVAPGAAATSSAPGRLAWSVVPSLIAWPTTAMSTSLGAATAAAGLGLAYAVDFRYGRKRAFPTWYMRLRLPLTVVAVSSLMATSFGTTTHDKTRTSNQP
eukprot:scaffold285_cov330-Pavlova_lutheri.AAC.95